MITDIDVCIKLTVLIFDPMLTIFFEFAVLIQLTVIVEITRLHNHVPAVFLRGGDSEDKFKRSN